MSTALAARGVPSGRGVVVEDTELAAAPPVTTDSQAGSLPPAAPAVAAKGAGEYTAGRGDGATAGLEVDTAARAAVGAGPTGRGEVAWGGGGQWCSKGRKGGREVEEAGGVLRLQSQTPACAPRLLHVIQ